MEKNKRLPLDLYIPDTILARRGAISFGSYNKQCCKPRLERRGAISFDKSDKNALYVRKLGDVRMRGEESKSNVRSKLLASEAHLLQGLSQPSYKNKCGQRFLTLTNMKQRRKSLLKTSDEDGYSLLDDFYKSQTKCLLSRISQWSFDVFSLDKSSNGRSLFHVVLKLFQDHNLIDHFNLDIVKLMKFASLVEEHYHNNPYHNGIHAADVSQAMHCYITQEKIAKHMTPLETMVSIVSAITHDLDHPGVNQAFLIATSNHLASLYKNNAVLENHHWRTAVGLLTECGLFDHLPRTTWQQIVQQLKSLILATDMTRQQEFYIRLKEHVEGGDLDLSRSDHRHFVLQIALKCADISNPCRSWSVCKLWSDRVCDEFFQQGDYERKLSLPITSLCDKYKTTVPKIQTGFIDFVVRPLFKEFQRFMQCDVLDEQLNNLYSNRNNWQVIIDQSTPGRPVTIDIDINSNLETKECETMSLDDESISDDLPSPTTSEEMHSDIDETPSDINNVRTDIAIVAGRLDWVDASDSRRHSLPAASLMCGDLFLRRESFPRVEANRRISLPHTDVYQAVSFDRLVERLTQLEKELQTKNDNKINLDNLICKPRISTLSPNMETSKLTSYLVAKKLLFK